MENNALILSGSGARGSSAGAINAAALALLDNSPLRQLLSNLVQFHHIQQRINQGKLHALCITALGYNSGESVSFFQGHPSLRG